MSQQREYRLKIEAYTPDTIPMSRLAEYMGDLATLLGEPHSVHFVGLESGSMQIVSAIDYEAVPKVEDRVLAVKRKQGPRDARDAVSKINKRLKEDNGTATLRSDDTEIIRFPGREEMEPLSFGVLNQEGTLDGVVMVVGGTLDPVPVHIQSADSSVVYLCDASRTLAKDLAKHFLGAELRVSGTGRWSRDEEGNWALERFRIRAFDILSDDPLSVVVESLRKIPGNDWDSIENPWAELDVIRHGPRERD
jgi:hypothetical protein